MTRVTVRLIAFGLVASLGLGLAIALVTSGDERVITLESWLAATAVLMVALTAGPVLRALPVTSERALGVVAPARPAAARTTARAQALRNLDRVVLPATSDIRSFTTLLRPRLAALAAATFGSAAVPSAVASVLDQTDRPPSIEELHAFFDALEAARP